MTGQVADAFVAMGTPNALRGRRSCDAREGAPLPRSRPGHDGRATGGVRPIRGTARGGWRYGWNSGSADNSTAQWGAITGLAGENAWNIPVPAFVKTENLNFWLKASQNMTTVGLYEGRFRLWRHELRLVELHVDDAVRHGADDLRRRQK